MAKNPKPKLNPVQRIRDARRYIKPQQHVSFEEWEDISKRASYAAQFLQPENPINITMRESLLQAENMIMENRLREVKEVHVISDTLQKIFTTPKKIQDDEVVGQIKYIRTFLAELQTWIDFKAELERKEAEGVIAIQRSKE